MKAQFLDQGFTSISNIVEPEEVAELASIYDELLADKARTVGLRSDLNGGTENGARVEKITQIMRPSLVEPKLAKHSIYKNALRYAQEFLGADIALDFDMLINKAPHTDAQTPWHQDAAYWIDMPDKRAASCWIALDEVYEENGCMWFIPKNGDTLLPHEFANTGGALSCDPAGQLANATAVPLSPGSCTFHDGFTLHFSKGNRTDSQRRALILNFRPAAMIALERQKGVDHTGDRKLRNSK